MCRISQTGDATKMCLIKLYTALPNTLITQTLNKVWLTLVSTDYVRYFTSQAFDSVLKKFELILNRTLIGKLTPKTDKGH